MYSMWSHRPPSRSQLYFVLAICAALAVWYHQIRWFQVVLGVLATAMLVVEFPARRWGWSDAVRGRVMFLGFLLAVLSGILVMGLS